MLTTDVELLYYDSTVSALRRIPIPVSARNFVYSVSEHGIDRCSVDLDLIAEVAAMIPALYGELFLRSSVLAGARKLFRVEDITLTDRGVSLAGFGCYRSLADLPYNALWSTTKYDQWFECDTRNFADARPEIFEIDTKDRLYAAPVAGERFSTGRIARLGFVIPHLSSRNVLGISYDYSFFGAIDWHFGSQIWTPVYPPYSGAWSAGATIMDIAGTGALITRRFHNTFTAAAGLAFYLYYNNAALTALVGDTGDIFMQITNLRIVSRASNQVNTTLGTAIAAGTRTVTPGSMTGIYVGQRLRITTAASDEGVTVTAITSTTFTAVFALAHLATDAVQGFVIYPQEIINDIIATISASNPIQLSSSTVLVANSGIDIQEAVYQDANPQQIAEELAGYGDNATTPQRYVVGVDGDQRVFFKPRTSSLVWYIDIASIEITFTYETLANEVYVIYTNTSQQAGYGSTLRTSTLTSSDSAARYGIHKRTTYSMQAPTQPQYTSARAILLAERKVITPKIKIDVVQTYSAGGQVVPYDALSPIDQVVIRNLPTAPAALLDKVRRFVISQVEVDVDNHKLSLVPELPPDDLEWMLIRDSLQTTPYDYGSS